MEYKGSWDRPKARFIMCYFSDLDNDIQKETNWVEDMRDVRFGNPFSEDDVLSSDSKKTALFLH